MIAPVASCRSIGAIRAAERFQWYCDKKAEKWITANPRQKVTGPRLALELGVCLTTACAVLKRLSSGRRWGERA